MKTIPLTVRRPLRWQRASLLAFTSAVLLSACGGGGGGNDDVSRQWSDAATLEPASSTRHVSNVVALAQDARGNALALWQNELNTPPQQYELQGAGYRPGHGWETYSLTMGEDTPIQAALAMNERGNGLAVFTNRKNDIGMSLLFAYNYRASSGWAQYPILLNESALEKSDLQVAVDPAGRALIVWQEDNQIVGCLLVPDVPDCQPEAISDAIEGNASAPQLFMDKQGHTLLLWTQNLRIRGRRYQDGSWAAPFLATGLIKDNHYATQQNDSDLLLIWERTSPGPNPIELLASRISLASTAAPGPSSIIPGFTGLSAMPALAINSDTALVAWQNWQAENGNSQYRLYASQEKNGHWEPVRKVADTQTSPSMPPSQRLILNTNGQARLWWSDDNKDYVGSLRSDGSWTVDTEWPYSFYKYMAQAGNKTLLASETQAWVTNGNSKGRILPFAPDLQPAAGAINSAGMATLLFMSDGDGKLVAHTYR